MSLYRLAPLRLWGVTGAVASNGQDHWGLHEAADKTITVEEALDSPQTHFPDAWGVERFLRFVGVDGTGPP